MRFAVLMVWHDPNDHYPDRYFCMKNVAGFSNKNKSKIVHPDGESALKRLPDDAANPTANSTQKQPLLGATQL